MKSQVPRPLEGPVAGCVLRLLCATCCGCVLCLERCSPMVWFAVLGQRGPLRVRAIKLCVL